MTIPAPSVPLPSKPIILPCERCDRMPWDCPCGDARELTSAPLRPIGRGRPIGRRHS